MLIHHKKAKPKNVIANDAGCYLIILIECLVEGKRAEDKGINAIGINMGIWGLENTEILHIYALYILCA